MTISEIAKLAGTSRGTVDRVINGRGKVNKELAEKIMQIVKSSEYEVNGSARALSMSQKKYVVGIVINSIGNPFFSRVRQGFEDSCKKWENFGLEMYYKEIRGYNEEEQIEAIDDVAARGGSGRRQNVTDSRLHNNPPFSESERKPVSSLPGFGKRRTVNRTSVFCFSCRIFEKT